jgi:hypothetical protein
MPIPNSMSSTQVDAIRKSFRETVRRRTGMDTPSTTLETTLIRNGSYCGRRFSLHGYSLIWFIDEQQIKLYAQDGSLLHAGNAHEFSAAAVEVRAVPELRVDATTRRAA